MIPAHVAHPKDLLDAIAGRIHTLGLLGSNTLDVYDLMERANVCAEPELEADMARMLYEIGADFKVVRERIEEWCAKYDPHQQEAAA